MTKRRERLDDEPSPSVPNGRTSDGRFTAGNRLARGNPLARQVQALRTALLSAVTPDDLVVVTKRLVKEARTGNLVAMKILYDRLLGPSIAVDLLERLERIEEVLEIGQ